MDTESLLKSARVARGYMHKRVEGLSRDQLLAVPAGAENNILWNLGHIVLSNYRLVYRPCGAAVPVASAWEGWFLPGTSPANWGGTPPSVDEVLAEFHAQVDRIQADYRKGAFKAYKPFQLKSGSSLESLDEALAFNLMHEGIHIGAIIALRHRLGHIDTE
jgi:hypothetical protein